MADITEKCKQIIADLENTIKDSKDAEFAKTQVYSLLQAFLEEVEKIEEDVRIRVDKLAQHQAEIDSRLLTIEKDIYEDDEEIEIACPYCNYVFAVEFEEIENEIVCPECDNAIELDWNSGCSCSCCNEHCDDECDYVSECSCNDYEDDEEDM